MENTLILTQISSFEFQQMLRQEIKQIFVESRIGEMAAQTDQISGIDLAIEITGLAKATIYSLVSERKIPHSKRGKRLYFSRRELNEWLAAGKRRTQTEIAADATNFGQNKGKR